MPLVDGILSARMIRIREKESQLQHQSDDREPKSPKPRIPIIAVDNTLDDNSRFDYIQTGYVLAIDIAWMIKVVPSLLQTLIETFV
jgi:hypothetical protein